MKSKSPQGLNKSIARIAFPAIVSNITVPLLGICDTAVTGHLGDPGFVAAIAVGTMMFNVLLWPFGFLRMGTTGLTAQALGGGMKKECSLMFTRALILALFIGVSLILFQLPLLTLLSVLLNSTENVNSLAKEYFSICVWGTPGILGSMAISGWFLGMQDSTRPMIIAITTNIVNILGSILLTYPLGMGFSGTATGTLIANWFSLFLALILVKNFCGGPLPWTSLKEAIRIEGLKRFFRVNGDIFFRSFFIMAVSLGITAGGSRLGEMTLAANAIIMQMFFLFSYFMDGFAFAAEALSGKAVGAKDYSFLSRIVRRLLLWSIGVTILFTLVYLFAYHLFAGLLAPDEALLNKVESLRIWIWLIPGASFLAFIFDGFFIGLTATRTMLIATASASLVFFATIAFTKSDSVAHSEQLLWIAFEAYLFTRGTLLSLAYPSAVRKFKRPNHQFKAIESE